MKKQHSLCHALIILCTVTAASGCFDDAPSGDNGHGSLRSEVRIDFSTIQGSTASGELLAGDASHSIPYTVIDSGQQGDTALIVGGMHGNEYAGFTAADEAVGFVPLRGKLIVMPRANRRAIDRDTRDLPADDPYFVADPAAGTDDAGNLDRYFPEPGQTSDSANAHTGLGKAIWQFVTDQEVKWFLNCHESKDYRYYDTEKTGQTLIHYDDPLDGAWIVARMNEDLVNIDGLTAGTGAYLYKQFVLLVNPVSGSLTRAISDVWDEEVSQDKRAFTFETARDSATAAEPDLGERVRYQKRAMQLLLVRARLIDETPVACMYTPPTLYKGPHQVTWEARGGLAPFDYIVEYRRSTEETWRQLYAGNDTGTTFASGTAGAGYYFRVKARSSDTATFGAGYGEYAVNEHATYSFNAAADATLRQDAPNKNFGSEPSLRVDADPVRKTYMKFTLSNVVFPITGAWICLYYEEESPESGGNLRIVNSNDWSERTITYNNRPLHSVAGYGELGPVAAGTWAFFNVTDLINANASYSFAVVTWGTDGCSISARESGENKPHLYIEK